MRIGHFVAGMMNGTIDRKQSPNVDQLLCEDTLKFLYNLGRDTPHIHESTYIYTWPHEHAITKTVIRPASDSAGRSDLINHTLIIKFDDVLNDILDHTSLLTTVEQQWQDGTP